MDAITSEHQDNRFQPKSIVCQSGFPEVEAIMSGQFPVYPIPAALGPYDVIWKIYVLEPLQVLIEVLVQQIQAVAACLDHHPNRTALVPNSLDQTVQASLDEHLYSYSRALISKPHFCDQIHFLMV